MSEPVRLDGVEIAGEIKREVAARVAGLEFRPGLAVILVGAGSQAAAASEIYVRSKVKTCAELGIYSEMITPPETVTTDELLRLVTELNERDEIDGILIQLPLPGHVDTKTAAGGGGPGEGCGWVPPGERGAAGEWAGRAAALHAGGVMEMLARRGISVAGKDAVVIGRSDIVGKPMASLLLNASATVTVCHSRTVGLAGLYAAGGRGGSGYWACGICDCGDGEAGSRAGGCGHQPGDFYGGV